MRGSVKSARDSLRSGWRALQRGRADRRSGGDGGVGARARDSASVRDEHHVARRSGDRGEAAPVRDSVRRGRDPDTAASDGGLAGDAAAWSTGFVRPSEDAGRVRGFCDISRRCRDGRRVRDRRRSRRALGLPHAEPRVPIAAPQPGREADRTRHDPLLAGARWRPAGHRAVRGGAGACDGVPSGCVGQAIDGVFRCRGGAARLVAGRGAHGDDIRVDIAGAQAAGLEAALVRTGRFRPSDL